MDHSFSADPLDPRGISQPSVVLKLSASESQGGGVGGRDWAPNRIQGGHPAPTGKSQMTPVREDVGEQLLQEKKDSQPGPPSPPAPRRAEPRSQ